MRVLIDQIFFHKWIFVSKLSPYEQIVYKFDIFMQINYLQHSLGVISYLMTL